MCATSTSTRKKGTCSSSRCLWSLWRRRSPARNNDLIDAHVWLRREAHVNRRPLTLDCVPDELLAECGLRPGGAKAPSYRCTDPSAILVPVASVIGRIDRKLN